MILDVEGIRPALISEKSFQYLNELRGFRYFFRHAYTYGFDDERVGFLLRRILKQKKVVLDDLNCFRQKISSILKISS